MAGGGGTRRQGCSSKGIDHQETHGADAPDGKAARRGNVKTPLPTPRKHPTVAGGLFDPGKSFWSVGGPWGSVTGKSKSDPPNSGISKWYDFYLPGSSEAGRTSAAGCEAGWDVEAAAAGGGRAARPAGGSLKPLQAPPLEGAAACGRAPERRRVARHSLVLDGRAAAQCAEGKGGRRCRECGGGAAQYAVVVEPSAQGGAWAG